ncbi:MAG: NAD(P)/FAD-dependent oxidoreductase [Deltaproteobacteria bacterium]|nr:NAD(P)/FAD-dependent oxidoreductase [Deltaproteobacteria bacterium]
MAQIVVLGGGFGGIVAATGIRKKLGNEHKIILVDKAKEHIFSPSLLWLILGKREPERIQRDLGLLREKGIEYINAEVQRIDPSRRVVITSTGNIDYDYLIISLGAELAQETIPGYKEGYNFYCLNGAMLLRDELKGFTGGRVAVVISSTPFKCPAAPYEAALLIDSYLSKGGIRGKTGISIYTPEALPMPTAGPEMGNVVKGMVEGRGIAFNPEKRLKSIEDKELIFEGGERVKADLIALVPPHRAPAAVRESGLTNETGWIPIDGRTMKTRFEGVYAIGDVTANRLPSGMMLPKAGVFAHYQAEVVAHNLVVEINGKGSLMEFDGRGYCFLEMGHGMAGFASGDFYAEPKLVVNLRRPGRIWHWGKVAFERWWMWRWF